MSTREFAGEPHPVQVCGGSAVGPVFGCKLERRRHHSQTMDRAIYRG